MVDRKSEQLVERYHLLVDGGVTDRMGDVGLKDLPRSKYVVHVTGSAFLRSRVSPAANSDSTLSVVITDMPKIGPLTMWKGGLAADVAERRIESALDQKLLQGDSDGHYVLPLDLSFDDSVVV